MIFNQVVKGGNAPTPTIEEKDVNFWDYDGTLVASYTKSEIAELASLPPAPNHSEDEVPLTFEYWNWDLADIKDFVLKYGFLDIGAIHKPTDNKTHIIVNMDNIKDISLSIGSNITVDWGDGNEGVYSSSASHIYDNFGIYNITLSDGTGLSFSTQRISSGKIIKVYLNYGLVYFPSFYGLNNLVSIVIPSTINNSSYENQLQYTSSLKCVNFPKCDISYLLRQGTFAYSGVSIICFPKHSTFSQSSNLFEGLNNLKRIALLVNGDSTNSSFAIYRNMASLEKYVAVLPAGSSYYLTYVAPVVDTIIASDTTTLKSINTHMFTKSRIRVLDCRYVTVIPSLASTSVFDSNNSNYIVIVPDSLYENWITATNWSDVNIVSHIKKASEVTLS